MAKVYIHSLRYRCIQCHAYGQYTLHAEHMDKCSCMQLSAFKEPLYSRVGTHTHTHTHTALRWTVNGVYLVSSNRQAHDLGGTNTQPVAIYMPITTLLEFHKCERRPQNVRKLQEAFHAILVPCFTRLQEFIHNLLSS